ncbi:HipA N-terminal domain-containing protein [Rhodovulum steppense]|uniref:HipA N-terminal domain-containing protein n=1 Tax=Rhodovulum steppense TaxID=540251 RepID=UPI001047CC35|nr:HipA N-terminal domain-containing protein [Rhodovulum steppense]
MSRFGTLTRATDGAIGFTYDPAWLGSAAAFPVASALPLSKAKWQGDPVAAAFDNLLPDAEVAAPSSALSTSRVIAACRASQRVRNSSTKPIKTPAKVRIVFMPSTVKTVGRPRSLASFSLRAMWSIAAPWVAVCAPQACIRSITT